MRCYTCTSEICVCVCVCVCGVYYIKSFKAASMSVVIKVQTKCTCILVRLTLFDYTFLVDIIGVRFPCLKTSF